jgi:predicted amidohydrolase YtcJ
MNKRILIITLVLFLFSCKQDETKTADKIYFNAKIWTGDTANSWTEAIAIKGNEIIYTGKDYASFKDANTEMIDLGGKLMLPGFIDNHTHFLSGGYNLSGVDLRKARTPQEFISILKTFCKKYNDGRWILGGDWDHEAWGGELPTHNWIDSITGDHPVFLSRYDGHMALANTKAMQLAAINKNTPVPAGGEMKKDKNGEYTGVFKDEAMGLINKVIPNPSEKELDEYLQAAIQHAFENGVTQVHDVGSYGGWMDLNTYRRNYNNNKLPLRIYSFVPLSTWAKMDDYCKKEGKGNDMLRWGGLKGFMDGSLGSTTAWFYQPFLDDPKTSGFAVTDTNDIRKWVLSADSAGLHVTVHAIGDRANDFVLNVFEEAERMAMQPGRNSSKDHRFRIEHAQHISQAAIPRFAQLKVIPSMQPYHAIDDGRWAYKRLDDVRLKGTYAFKSLLDAKAHLTFGSDWTVAPLKPLEGIYAAVTRRTLDDKNPGGWYPEQIISVEQAIKCYTANNAFAGFQENKLGILKKGMLADMVVLNENIFEIAPEKIKEVKVLRTIVNGKEVFTSPLQN